MFTFTKEIAENLAKLRKQGLLSQKEVALRMGLNPKTAQSYIAQLEKGLIKNPFLSTILNYLDAIGVRWGTFFTELSKARDIEAHQEIMSRVKLPSDWKLQKKLDRDTLLYETKIKPPQNYYTRVDLKLVQQKIEKKVVKYCQNLKIKDELIPHYIEYAKEILVGSNYPKITDKYMKPGISRYYLTAISGIVNKAYRTEQKKIEKKKPLRLEKTKAMAEKYLQSRVKLAPIEAEISKILLENNLKETVWSNFYMNFGRECFSKIKKLYHKNPLLLRQHLAEITKKWHKQGLKPEILEKIKEITIKKSEINKDGFPNKSGTHPSGTGHGYLL